MKYWVLDQIFNKRSPQRHLEYLELDGDFNILDASEQVQRFADCPDAAVPGKDVRLGFPELIGVEDILTTILKGQIERFELTGIARFSESCPFYIDIYVICDEHETSRENKLIVFLEDVTTRMVLEQSLVQRVNEANLLASALNTSRNYIDRIITSIADALLVTTKAGTIKTVNQAALDLFGYSKEELIDQPISILIADYDFSSQASQHPLFRKNLKNVEVICKTKTGEKVFVAFSRSVIQMEIEGLQDFAYIGRDITEYHRTQKRQAAQYTTTRILSESATVSEAMPKILAAIAESLGWDVGELWTPNQHLGASVARDNGESVSTVLRCVEIWFKPTIAIPAFQAITWQTTLTSGVGLPGRIWATRSPHWITNVVDDPNFPRAEAASQVGLHAAFGFPIISDSDLLGVMTFFSCEEQKPDEELLKMMAAIGSQLGQFIKRKSAEAALLESEERYRDLFDNASDLIQCITLAGRFLYVNRAWRKTLGYSEAEMEELRVFNVIHPDGRKHWREIFSRAMSGENLEQVKAEFITKDGKKISLEGNISCKFVQGKPITTRAIFRDITQRLQAEVALRYQQQKTEGLLLNILPARIAERLKQEQITIAEKFTDVTVMFADLVGFTQLASSLPPIALVNLLNQVFSAFDRLCERHHLEKIKTIGDAYMVVGGLPARRADQAAAIAEMALDMQTELTRFNAEYDQELTMRIGIHSGPVVAGVIGIKKFNYDLWGDTVNTASRMESHGLPGRIQVTGEIYERLREQYLFEERGAIEVKGKGKMTTYFLIGRRVNESVLS